MDKARLEYEIKRKGHTIRELCEHLGIDRSTYYRKVSGVSEFTQGEIQEIINFLGIESPMGIFFAE